MSRSYKNKPIIKDKSGRKDYNKVFRRKERQSIKENKEPPIKIREIINDYEIIDWKFDFRKLSKNYIKRKIGK